MLQTICWNGAAARLLDQTLLPTQTVYVDIADERQMWDAIRRLVIRGAPAIGVAAAFGVYLGIRTFPADGDAAGFFLRLNQVCDYLATSRPTAVNLFWAIDRIRRVAGDPTDHGPWSVAAAQSRIFQECVGMLAEDNRVCRAIGQHGADLLASLSAAGQPLQILTHCNAGGLATVQFGTALAPIYVGAERGMKFHVYADETRPLLQGSRITAYELKENGIPVTVICDGMAATVMQQGKVHAVIVGADRIAANGDAANKIGTLGVAILARHFAIPFYMAAPTSTVDLSLDVGGQIPIEERDEQEISRVMGKQTAPAGVGIYNPAFDVTPAELISAIITEHGVLYPPYDVELRKVCGKGQGVLNARRLVETK